MQIAVNNSTKKETFKKMLEVQEGEEQNEDKKTVDQSIERVSGAPAGGPSRGHRAKRRRGSFNR
jgi:hypothetical protein